MRLIHQKEVLALRSLRKKTLQIYMGIKQIVVIPDNAIGKEADIQTELKGADPVLARIFLYDLPRKAVRMQQKIIDRIVDPVKMPLCVGAVLRVTLNLLHKADLFLRCQHHAFKQKSLFPQQREGIFRHGPGDGLCSQIKDLVPHAVSHRLDRRKNRGDRLANAGRRFDEKLLRMVDSLIDIGNQLLLPLPVRKRKGELFNGCLSFLVPLVLIIRPFPVPAEQLRKPCLQLLRLIFLKKVFQSLCFHIAVCHADTHLLLLILYAVDCRIDLCLCQMHRHRILDMLHITVSRLDFIHRHHIARLRNDSVRPPFHDNAVLLRIPDIAQKHLRCIVRPHPLLQHSMYSASLLHCIVGSSRASVVDIPAPQDKFHQISYRYPYFHPCSILHLSVLIRFTHKYKKLPAKDRILPR